MPKYIVIPLYDHAKAAEIDEILADIDTLGFSNDPFYVRTTEELTPTLSRQTISECAAGFAPTSESD